jgi:hypothetical protein
MQSPRLLYLWIEKYYEAYPLFWRGLSIISIGQSMIFIFELEYCLVQLVFMPAISKWQACMFTGSELFPSESYISNLWALMFRLTSQ